MRTYTILLGAPIIFMHRSYLCTDQLGTGNGRCDFSITSGSGITSCMRPKNDTAGSWVSCGTTGRCVSTKFVELMPNRADSMSTELRENASRGIWLGMMPTHGMAGLYAAPDAPFLNSE